MPRKRAIALTASQIVLGSFYRFGEWVALPLDC